MSRTILLPPRIIVVACSAVAALAGGAAQARAQRADANAITAAQDAFGVTLNGQSLGLYHFRDIRNFDPLKLGNLRIDGLYFDRQGPFTSQLIESSTVRVGGNTIDYAFPAPSGIVDFHIRDFREKDELALTAGLGPFLSPYLEVDVARRIAGDRWFATGGVGLNPRYYAPQGGYNSAGSAALNVIMRDAGGWDVSVFGNRIWDTRIYPQPIFYLQGDDLPPEPERGVDIGQPWATGEGSSSNLGVRGQLAGARPWSLGLGLFYSERALDRGFDQIFGAVDSMGAAAPVVYAYHDQVSRSLSGEARFGYRLTEGRVGNSVELSVRGRRLARRYGGEEVFDLGPGDIYSAPSFARPALASGSPPDRDDVVHAMAGTRYKLELAEIGLLSAGVLGSYYAKDFSAAPDVSSEETAKNLLFSAGVAGQVLPGVVLFLDHTQGVEEGGVAPPDATNRYELLPIIKSLQNEGGVRYSAPAISVDLAAFEARKPYPVRDAEGAYRLIGRVRNRGVEASVSARPIPAMKIVVGALWLDPELIEGASAMDEGKAPVGIPRRRAQLNLDYLVSSLGDLSVDMRVNYAAGVSYASEGTAELPQAHSVDLGLRFPFAPWQTPCVLRVQVTNVLDTFSWVVDTTGGMTYSAQRSFNLALTASL